LLAFITLASLQLHGLHRPCCTGVVARLLPSSHLHLCQHHAGIIAFVVLAGIDAVAWASLPTLHGRHCHICMDVVAVIIMASSPLHGCHSHQFSSVFALALSPSTRWRLCSSCTGFAPLRWHHCRHCAGVFAIPWSSLPTFRWRCCHHCADNFANIVLEVLPLSCWHFSQCGAGFALIALASLALLRWRCCQHCAGVFNVTWASLPMSRLSLRWRLYRHSCAGILTNVVWL
jgi:hypothetical protein